MTEHIQALLKSIETEHHVEILYACEAGSRAWGFASQDSDYDVRFIFIRPMLQYLTLNAERDVIECTEGEIDAVGWDLKKALFLFRKGNPPLREWLNSPIVYHHDMDRSIPIKRLQNLQTAYFMQRQMIGHYLGMAKRNWKSYLQDEQVWTKKYLYVLRPILACAWVQTQETSPPVKFDELWWQWRRLTGDRYNDDSEFNAISLAILELVERKKAWSELDEGPRIPALHDFLTKEIDYFTQVSESLIPLSTKRYHNLTLELESLFRECLLIRAGLL